MIGRRERVVCSIAIGGRRAGDWALVTAPTLSDSRKARLVLSHFLSPPCRFFLTWPVESPAGSSSLYLLEESDTSNSDESGGAPDLDDPFFDDLFFSAS